MASLLDLAPQGAQITVAGKQLTVHGISASGIATLLSRFPPLRDLLAGGSIDTEAIMAMGGDIVAAIIAAACGYPGNADAEKVASVLPVGDQVDILAAAIEQTMPGGAGPLGARLQALGDRLNLSASLPSSESATPAPAAQPPQAVNGLDHHAA